MTTNLGKRSPVIWIVSAFVLGGLVGTAMPVLALRFYVNITSPDATIVAFALVTGAGVWLMGTQHRLLAGLASTMSFAGGAYALMNLLLWGYPPNFS